jgi:hypothetical protein
MGRVFSMNGEKENVYRILAEKTDGRSPLGRSGHMCEDNVTRSSGKNDVSNSSSIG